MRHRCVASHALVAMGVLLVGSVAPATAFAATASAQRTSSPFHVRFDPTGATAFGGVSCPTATVCFAVGGGAADRAAVYRTANGGRSWARESTPAGMVPASRIACPTVSFCLAAGAGPYEPYFLATRNGGATWTEWPGASLFNVLVTQLTCAAPTDCVAALQSGGVLRSTNGGASWSLVRPSGLSTVTGVSCPSSSTCVAVGPGTATGTVAVARSTNGGASFGPPVTFTSPASPLPEVSCASTTSCAVTGSGAGGRLVELTATAGSTWHAVALPGIVASAVAVACPTEASCAVAAASSASNLVVASTTTGGASWSAASLAHAADASASPGALSCPTTAECVAVGFGTAPDAIFVRPAVSGAFRHISLPSGPGSLEAVACPTSRTCVAVGDGFAVRTTNGGASFELARGIPSTAALDGVACPTSATCLAVGELARSGGAPLAVVLTSSNAGRSWQRVGLPSGHATLAAVACATTVTCVAVSSDGSPTLLRTTDGGAAWTKVSVPAEATLSLNSVTCPTATTCVAVGVDDSGGVAVASTDAGATWSVPPGATGLGDYLESVSCVSASSCLAAGALQPVGPGIESTAMYGSSDGGSTWTAMPSAPSSFDVGSMACVATTCEELATPLGNLGPPTSTLETSTNGGASWSVTQLPGIAILSGLTATPAGRWVLVGTSASNGALVLTDP